MKKALAALSPLIKIALPAAAVVVAMSGGGTRSRTASRSLRSRKTIAASVVAASPPAHVQLFTFSAPAPESAADHPVEQAVVVTGVETVVEAYPSWCGGYSSGYASGALLNRLNGAVGLLGKPALAAGGTGACANNSCQTTFHKSCTINNAITQCNSSSPSNSCTANNTCSNNCTANNTCSNNCTANNTCSNSCTANNTCSNSCTANNTCSSSCTANNTCSNSCTANNTCSSPSSMPIISNLNGDIMSYLIGSGAKVIDQVQLLPASVTDSGTNNFNGGTLTVSIGSATADDQLGIRNQSAGANNITLSGSDVKYGGTTIGTFSFTFTSGTATLTVSFVNSSADITAVSALLNNITYANASLVSATSRSVSFILTDSLSVTSAPSTATINLIRPGFHVLWG